MYYFDQVYEGGGGAGGVVEVVDRDWSYGSSISGIVSDSRD